MDYRVDSTPEALEDIESTSEYISRDSEFYAKAVVTAIINLFRGVHEFPFMGRVVQEIGDENIRELFIY